MNVFFPQGNQNEKTGHYLLSGKRAQQRDARQRRIRFIGMLSKQILIGTLFFFDAATKYQSILTDLIPM